MVNERSAGVILFRDTPSGRVYLLLDYRRHWDYPKGHIEAGETDQTAALRELAEETGITDATFVEPFARELTYFFRKPKKGLIRKAVVFFLARTETETVNLSDEHVGHAWLEYKAALARVTYANAKDVLKHAEAFLAGGLS